MIYSPTEEALIHEAILYATHCHRGQYRKGTSIPYICHPINVMRKLAEYGLAFEILIAGLLHDVLEDTDASMEDIHAIFGPGVADLVLHASEQDRIASQDIEIPWQTRKEGTINHILSEQDTNRLFVPLADKLDNITAIRNDYEKLGDELWLRFNAGKELQSWYYTSLANAFMERANDATPAFKALAVEFRELVGAVFEHERPDREVTKA